MKIGLQLSDAIRFSYQYLEIGQQDLTVFMSFAAESNPSFSVSLLMT